MNVSFGFRLLFKNYETIIILDTMGLITHTNTRCVGVLRRISFSNDFAYFFILPSPTSSVQTGSPNPGPNLKTDRHQQHQLPSPTLPSSSSSSGCPLLLLPPLSHGSCAPFRLVMHPFFQPSRLATVTSPFSFVFFYLSLSLSLFILHSQSHTAFTDAIFAC